MDAAEPMQNGWVKEPIGRVAAPLRDQVLHVVRQAILDFDLRPGQRLIERELIEQLNVSRATVREVVARLAAEGLVTIVPQRGAIVSVISTEEAEDIYEMRASLEALAVQRFIERASDEHRAALREAIDDLRNEQLGRRNLDQVRAKDAIYRVLFEGADSPPLTEILTILQGRVRLLRATSLSTPGRSSAMVDEMQDIVEAIEARDVSRATAASALHVRNAASAAFRRFRDGNEVVAELID